MSANGKVEPKVFWCNRLKPRIRVSIDMPQNRYSLVSETPACGNGRSLFFRDLAQVISGTAERFDNIYVAIY